MGNIREGKTIQGDPGFTGVLDPMNPRVFGPIHDASFADYPAGVGVSKANLDEVIGFRATPQTG